MTSNGPCIVICLSALALYAQAFGAHAAGDSAEQRKRPAIKSNRWEEDWSVLADPKLRTEPLDQFKYIPLFVGDTDSYISFGMNLRERFESNDAPGFGIGAVGGDSYLLQRLQFHVDVHLLDTWQIFTQFEDVRAFGKETPTPADENQLDLRQAFLGYKHEFDSGTLLARVGRQEIGFDLQRFVSSRDGPNVRQAFDAVWAEWDATPWRFKGFVSQVVQYFDEGPFDDASSGNISFSALRFEHDVPNGGISGYYGFYHKESAAYLDASGDENRSGIDARYFGRSGPWDWDIEGMFQFGTVGSKGVVAWAVGSRFGYTFEDVAWEPRLGLQLDGASGDRHSGDDTVGTFNSLFANGSYFNLAGYTTYANLIHVKPSVTFKPTESATVMAAIGLQWRETMGDAIYAAPIHALAGTAGQGSNWTGYYTQLRLDYAINANLSAAAEYVHFGVGNTIRHAGGHDSDYFGGELKLAW
ncbi:alginate export family protein [Rhizobium lusitanum]|uniref:Alginate export domain-containing protein n=1 Tax=Rhizobium lusitanum TaxID=293958 RepID=A0A7X0IUS8_9HYPH|nr:alginate export family protein [Rhizobium lusitanum]MBB6487123.1 hypothetical protein [Rhizobium lusitanum]